MRRNLLLSNTQRDPKAEEIATALLPPANNPALFDKWAVRNGLPLKADGQVFTHAQWSPRDENTDEMRASAVRGKILEAHCCAHWS